VDTTHHSPARTGTFSTTVDPSPAGAVGPHPPGERLEPNGPVAAALLAAGRAGAAVGVLVVLGEASEAVHDALTVSAGAGPLSGKGLGATAIWLVAWPVLHILLRRRELPWRATTRTVALLVAVGLVGTFPPVFQLLAG